MCRDIEEINRVVFIVDSISAIEVLDSRGNPTIEARVVLNDKTVGRFIAPSGASVGIHEAVAKRDSDGFSVRDVINDGLAKIRSLHGMRFSSQWEFDAVLASIDGSTNKSILGGNFCIAVSVAFCVACASKQNLHISNYVDSLMRSKGYVAEDRKNKCTPMMNVINGGVHAIGGLDFQEIMITPIAFNTMSEKIIVGAKIFHKLREIFKERGYSTNVGDEGGVSFSNGSTMKALGILNEAIEKAGYNRNSVKISLDVAASNFCKVENGCFLYNLSEINKALSSEELCQFYCDIVKECGNILSIEDPFHEEDEAGWITIMKRLGDEIMIVGDDLFVTNHKMISHKKALANAIIIKPNQIGLLSEAIEAVILAKFNSMMLIFSHRSGDTEEPTIADIAFGCGSDFVKFGAPCRGERISKYNQLLRICYESDYNKEFF
ncbi:phosphopyruvate hydratase [Candidatus Fokinia crypta]|uniref:Enolase n=1 Tax=Candidatus Fokinia crypta TaxID=1920990 RepID=A0ABZ0UNL9_9RICK|nr:phosphopyruvate hydratase [Candidatus Fokinia cryptica]WPX97716.1 Enolase [Candidatus Fokinia cryptica]